VVPASWEFVWPLVHLVIISNQKVTAASKLAWKQNSLKF
jgi:hypothetical protein